MNNDLNNNMLNSFDIDSTNNQMDHGVNLSNNEVSQSLTESVSSEIQSGISELQPNVMDSSSVQNISNVDSNVSEVSSGVMENQVDNGLNDVQQNDSQVSPIVNSQIEVSDDDTSLDDVEISYFDGTLLELLGYYFLAGFIIGFTFGVFEPWAYCILKKYLYSHTVYDGKRLKFDGDPEDLFVQRFKWIFFTIITLGIYLFWVPVRKKQWEMSNVHFEDEPKNIDNSYFTGSVLGLFGTNLLCVFLVCISLGLLAPLAYCKRLKWFLNNSVISSCYVDFQGKASKLFLKWLKWGFLTLITLGIYGLWIGIKLTKWEVENTGLLKDDGTQESLT